MAKRVKIPGRLESAEVGGIVTGAGEIIDDVKGKKQSVINSEVDAELVRLENEKQDNLTFDDEPTAGSNNPVTSGAVYTADKALSDAIEAILLLIPSAASVLNQLADKTFVRDSISTATATPRGTFNVVSDLHLSVNATHAQIEAALDALSLGADLNDYCFVQIPDDESTENIKKTERYKFNGTGWVYEYDLNNSGFTAAQWEAINSNITALLVTKLSQLPTNEVLTALLAAKQDNLTFDDEPTAGSNNPVTSGGIYTRDNEIVAMITALEAAKQNVLTFDSTPINGSENPVTSGGVYEAIYLVQVALAGLDGRMLSAEHSIEVLTENVGILRTLYQALSQSDIIVGAKPTTGVANIIYRVPGSSTFADWMYYNGAWVKLAEYTTLDGYLYKGIATPNGSPAASAVKMFYFALTPGTYTNFGNLVVKYGINILKYDGANWTLENLGNSDGVFDVTEYSGSSFASLEALLSDENLSNLIPVGVRKGGMSIKFVHSVDNKYVQYRLMSDEWSTTESDWQGVDDEPTTGSDNLVKSGGVYDKLAIGAVYDISDANNGQYYDSLTDALGTNAQNIPVSRRRPGMSIKFNLRTQTGVDGNDDPVYSYEYVQYRYMLSDVSDVKMRFVENWNKFINTITEDEAYESFKKTGGTIRLEIPVSTVSDLLADNKFKTLMLPGNVVFNLSDPKNILGSNTIQIYKWVGGSRSQWFTIKSSEINKTQTITEELNLISFYVDHTKVSTNGSVFLNITSNGILDSEIDNINNKITQKTLFKKNVSVVFTENGSKLIIDDLNVTVGQEIRISFSTTDTFNRLILYVNNLNNRLLGFVYPTFGEYRFVAGELKNYREGVDVPNIINSLYLYSYNSVNFPLTVNVNIEVLYSDFSNCIQKNNNNISLSSDVYNSLLDLETNINNGIFNRKNYLQNMYLGTSGKLIHKDGYYVTDYIDISDTTTIKVNVSNSDYYSCFYYYNNNKELLSNISLDGYTTRTQQTNGAAYVRVCAKMPVVETNTVDILSGLYYIQRYIPTELSINIFDVSEKIDSIRDNFRKTYNFNSLGVEGTITQNQYLRTLSTHIFPANTLSAHIEGNIIDILLGYGYNGSEFEHYGFYIQLTTTEVKVIRQDINTVTDISTAQHGLTLTSVTDIYISNINSKSYVNTCDLFICTSNGDTYKQKILTWFGSGSAFIKNNGNSSISVKLKTFPKYLNSKMWIFGDSYFSMWNDNRWPYYLYDNGFTNLMFNHLSGQTPENGFIDLQNLLLTNHLPSYIVWCHGMNGSGDTIIDGEYVINPSKKNIIDWLKNFCEDNNVTLILATIPTALVGTSVLLHEGLNNYIRSLGVRYIDFADAVGAQPDGSWTPGLCSDGVHPTVAGAKVLYARAIADLPELTLL